jgi:UDP-N-acetylmuramoyl-tripeptide--D-alanyl-D-alanine ligase
MWDYDYFHDMSKGIPHIVTYGTHDAEYSGDAVMSEPYLHVRMTGEVLPSLIYIPSWLGTYNLPNILAAVTVGEYFKVPAEKIKTAIESYQPTNSRSQLMEKNGNTFILDAYNANPSSMKLAIENFYRQHHPKKVCLPWRDDGIRSREHS